MYDVLEVLRQRNPTFVVETPFSSRLTLQASHMGGTRRPEQIFDNVVWDGVSRPTRSIVLVDDVITSGAHFKACQRMLQMELRGIAVVGVFWAKAIRID